MSERKNFGKLKEVIPLPNLIENQLNSYVDFLQMDVPPSKRRQVGLHAVLSEIFPIESYDGKHKLEYVSYDLVGPKMSEVECIKEARPTQLRCMSPSACAKRTALKKSAFHGDINMMTKSGSFIVNGAERVVVSQLHRSPGICFEQTLHSSDKMLYSFRLIPDRGTWVEIQFDQNDLLYVYIDRRRRRRKFLITTLLRAFGTAPTQEIVNLFYKVEDLSVEKALKMENISHFVLAEPVTDPAKGVVLLKQYETLTTIAVQKFKAANIREFKVIDTTVDDGAIVRAIKKDKTKNEESA